MPSRNPDFIADLFLLEPYLTETKALYILLKTHPNDTDGYAAITYVPNAAPVREKMLYASSRLTLARELGVEHFRQTLLVTSADELTAEGWAKHEAHLSQPAPLTEEESGLRGVVEAEAQESQGTTGRRGHVESTSKLPVAEGVVEALSSLREEGCRGTLVQLCFALPDETLRLDSSIDDVGVAEVGGKISASEPRYSFYAHPETGEVYFVYSCPAASKVKERMVYSTAKTFVRKIAERDAGIVIARSLEASDPKDDLTADVFGGGEGLNGSQDAGPGSKPAAGGFARPKRPGRR